MKTAVCAFAAASFFTIACFGGEVYLNNGDRITGTVKHVVEGKLTIETAAAGEITIPLSEVKTFTTDTEVDVVLTDGSTLKQKVNASEQAGAIRATGGAIAEQDIPLSNISTVNPPPIATDWEGSVQAGIVATSGNSETIQANVGFDAIKRGVNDRITFNGQYLFGRQEDPDTGEDNTTTDSWYASGKYDYFLTKKVYLFGMTRVERDRIAELELRLSPSAGVGYQWIETERTHFNTEAGVGWVYEDYEDVEKNDYIAARFAYHFDHAINERVDFFHNLEYIPSLEHGDEFNINADAGLRVSLTDSMFSEGKIEWRHDSEPPPDIDKDDVRYLLSVGWRF